MFASATGVTLAHGAKGIIAPIAKGGKSASAGARKNTNRSTVPGAKSSLKNDFTPSAMICGTPLRMRTLRPLRKLGTMREDREKVIVPVRFGPTRSCI